MGKGVTKAAVIKYAGRLGSTVLTVPCILIRISLLYCMGALFDSCYGAYCRVAVFRRICAVTQVSADSVRVLGIVTSDGSFRLRRVRYKAQQS